MKKAIVGDIFEIETTKGKAYLHFVQSNSDTGEIVRVLPGLFIKEPKKIEDLASKKENYYVGFSVSPAFKKGILKHVGFLSSKNYTIPKFMRSKHIVRGKYLGWHIIDTNNWKRKLVKELSLEEGEFSPWGVWSLDTLVDKLENKWLLKDWN